MWRMPVGRSSSRVPPGKERGSSPASHCPVSERRSGGARVRVVLADDHPTIRAGVRRIVEAVARGEGYFSPAVARLIANHVVERGRHRTLLSSREREVVQLISEGSRLSEIAARLFVSIATVKTHRANAMRKIGARTTAGL